MTSRWCQMTHRTLQTVECGQLRAERTSEWQGMLAPRVRSSHSRSVKHNRLSITSPQSSCHRHRTVSHWHHISPLTHSCTHWTDIHHTSNLVPFFTMSTAPHINRMDTLLKLQWPSTGGEAISFIYLFVLLINMYNSINMLVETQNVFHVKMVALSTFTLNDTV